MSGGKSLFGSATRVADGCIVTFELPDGKILVEQFTQLLRTAQKHLKRKVTIEGDPYILQAINRADALGAKIVCISSPSTIYTDLRRARVQEAVDTGDEPDVIYPERVLLGRHGRMDLFKRPGAKQ